ncbi:hypothetical protein QYM36_008554, partial [Artemia franciscana]
MINYDVHSRFTVLVVTSQLYDRPLEEISEKAIAWDQEEHLKFRVPFPDLKVTIFLDSLLPRVIELATSNSDRRVKLAACEVLHAFFVYMIGIGSERTEEYGRHHRLEKLYERTFPVVITLASDLDDVVRKIFQVLLGQTVRWFSKPISTENGPRLTNEADKILSCILDKLENVNPIIRNVAGEALCEFCTWNVKQTKPKDLSKPDIIKRILKNLYSLALHPSQTKRMGACTGWNATYREFREHQLLVEMFTFELLWHFMECLAKCDQDAKYSPTVLQAISAVRHLKRIVFEKSNLFLKPKKVVRAPPNFPLEPSLKDIMFWLFQHIARPEKEARRLTIELFFDFLPKISDTSGAAKFVKDEMAEGSLSKLISILESDLNLKHINDSVFMRALEASLEAYTSLFEAGVVNPDEILTDPASSLLEKIKFLVKKITSSLKVEIDNREEIFVKCSVLVQLLKFITALLQSNSSVTLSTILENGEMFQLIKTLVFSPDTLGFHLLELTCHESLEQVKRALLASSSKNMPLNFFESFCSILEDGIDVSVEVNKVLSDETCSTQMIAGVSLFLETLEPKLRKGWKFYMDPTEILSMVIKAIKEKHKHAKNILWSSRQQKAFSSVVRLSTIMDLEVESAIRLLENEAANFWYDISTLIIPFLALGFSKKKEYFEKLVDLIGQCQGRVVESLMIEYINIVRDKQKADSDQVNFMMKHLSEKWSKLSSWASMDSEKSHFLVICLQKLPIDSNLFEWLTGLLCKRELNIEVKLQALSAMKQKNNLVEEEEKILAQSLNYLSALHFPLKTYDIKEEGSRAEFLRIFDQVLNTAIALSSNSMMRFLLQTVSGEHSHLRFAATKMAVNEMVQRASPDSQGCLIATFFDLVLHQNLNPETIRYVHELGEGVLIHSNFIKFKDGITSVIPEIVSKLEEVNMGSKEQITLKTICFQILTIVFTRLDKETINADINKAFCKSKNLDGLDSKAFLKKVVGVSDGTRSESLNIPSDCAEDYRKYHCAAYNCLIAIVTCTQTAEKFYVGYLYKEPKHIQATTFFEYLIVDDDIYFEDKNVGDLSKMKKYFVNLRLNSNHDESTSQNLRYLPSQTLVQSSLSEDFSRFDFSTSNLKERTHKLTKDRNTIELVQDPLNEHECMAQLVAVLLHMDDLELFKTPELPQSLKEIKEKLTNARVPLIVQVFLGKLIFNTSHIIERYSGEFLGPLLRVIARILGERKHFPPVARDLVNDFDFYDKISFQSLNYLSALHFPLKTYDIKEEGSRAEFLRIFDQVLNTAIALSSNSMMRFLLQTVSGEHSHLRFAATKMAVNEMVQRASPDSQGCLIATFFDLVLHQNLNPETIRYVHELGEGVLIHSNFIKFKDGITSVIPEIVSKLEEVNMGSKEQITLKTICFQILTIVFTRLDKETINADINKAFCKSKNLDGLDSKAFLKKVVGVSDGTRSESLNIPSDCAEDYRKYHCAAYNCLIAIVTCTQTAEKFYVGYLYKEPKHIQATTFFEYLIVDDDIYFEDKNVGDLSKMKKYFVNLRLNSNHDESTSQNLRYLPSQTLVQSSLSEDFSRFDFSTSNLKERTHKLSKDRNTIELVQDPLNEHECMAQLVAVLLHMDDLELFKTPELPQSLKEIKEKLTNARVPLIVQVFLGKLIFNTSHIIERYSGEFLGPLLRVIARILGERKHFPPVARDLLALTLSWAPRNLPDPDSVVERTHVNKIIESLVEGSARSSSKSQKLLLEIL